MREGDQIKDGRHSLLLTICKNIGIMVEQASNSGVAVEKRWWSGGATVVEWRSSGVEEMDSLMEQMSYARIINRYYYLKHGCNLEDGLYNSKEYVNLELLKKNVLEHKMIDIYVEHSNTRLDVYEMTTNSIRSVFNELDEELKKTDSASIPSYEGQNEQEFDYGNDSKSEGYDIEDEVTENIKDGNLLVDEDNTIEEPGVEVSLFEVSTVAQI
nr:hypothetical protein [Tanacetum cinerariifolium]